MRFEQILRTSDSIRSYSKDQILNLVLSANTTALIDEFLSGIDDLRDILDNTAHLNSLLKLLENKLLKVIYSQGLGADAHEFIASFLHSFLLIPALSEKLREVFKKYRENIEPQNL